MSAFAPTWIKDHGSKAGATNVPSMTPPSTRLSGQRAPLGSNQQMQRWLSSATSQRGAVPVLGSTVLQRQAASPQPATTPARQTGPWDDLPESARKVLQHSFDTSDHSKCGKPGNEEWMWCRASAAESFNALDKERQAAFRMVHAALVRQALWGVVNRVIEVQSQNDPGIKAEATSTASLFELLISNPKFCRDTPLGGKLHPGETTWRQVVTGDEGLHVGGGTKNRMSAHLDRTAPVAERQVDGFCRYSMPNLLPHFSQDVMGWRNLEILPSPGQDQKPGDVQPIIRFRIPGT